MYVFCTAVWQFYGVFVAHAEECGPMCKVLLYQREELLADVGSHALAKRWIEPNYLPFISLPAGGGAAWFGWCSRCLSELSGT